MPPSRRSCSKGWTGHARAARPKLGHPSSGLVSQRYRTGAELPPAYQFQIDILRKALEKRRPVARDPGMYHEVVLVDQAHLGQRKRKRHAPEAEVSTRLLLEPLDGLLEVAADELRIPIDPIQGFRHDVLLRCMDRLGEGHHP